MIGLCDNCALKYADCKGDKSLEKTRCDYYKKPVVMNVKELAERVAELEIENERLRRITEAPTADVVEVTDKSMIPLVKDFIKDLEKLGDRATCADIIKSIKR